MEATNVMSSAVHLRRELRNFYATLAQKSQLSLALFLQVHKTIVDTRPCTQYKNF